MPYVGSRNLLYKGSAFLNVTTSLTRLEGQNSYLELKSRSAHVCDLFIIYSLYVIIWYFNGNNQRFILTPDNS